MSQADRLQNYYGTIPGGPGSGHECGYVRADPQRSVTASGGSGRRRPAACGRRDSIAPMGFL
jgi:hypothetical protein